MCAGRRTGPIGIDPHQASKVKDKTLLLYRKSVGSVVAWLESNNFYPTEAEELDDALLEWKAATIPTKAKFEMAVASLEFLFPRFKGRLQWSRSVIAGWNASHSPKHTTPLPRGLSRLVGVHLVSRRYPRMAIGLCLQHARGVRPGELLQLVGSDVLLPEDQAGAVSPCAIVSLGTTSGTKAKRRQYTLVKDPMIICLLRYLLAETAPTAKLFPYSYSTYSKLLKSVVKQDLNLDLTVTPHSARAGFATDCIASGMPFDDVRQLGRWAAESSLRGYIDIVTSASVAVQLRVKHLGQSINFADDNFLSFFAGAQAFARVSDSPSNAAKGPFQVPRRLVEKMEPAGGLAPGGLPDATEVSSDDSETFVPRRRHSVRFADSGSGSRSVPVEGGQDVGQRGQRGRGGSRRGGRR